MWKGLWDSAPVPQAQLRALLLLVAVRHSRAPGGICSISPSLLFETRIHREQQLGLLLLRWLRVLLSCTSGGRTLESFFRGGCGDLDLPKVPSSWLKNKHPVGFRGNVEEKKNQVWWLTLGAVRKLKWYQFPPSKEIKKNKNEKILKLAAA